MFLFATSQDDLFLFLVAVAIGVSLAIVFYTVDTRYVASFLAQLPKEEEKAVSLRETKILFPVFIRWKLKNGALNRFVDCKDEKYYIGEEKQATVCVHYGKKPSLSLAVLLIALVCGVCYGLYRILPFILELF